eukprot:4519244-Prymnesium_polylepis.1
MARDGSGWLGMARDGRDGSGWLASWGGRGAWFPGRGAWCVRRFSHTKTYPAAGIVGDCVYFAWLESSNVDVPAPNTYASIPDR